MTVNPELLKLVRHLYTEWTGHEIAEAHRILRKEFDAYSLTPGKILSATNQPVDPKTPEPAQPKRKVSRVAKVSKSTEMSTHSDQEAE